MLEDESCPVIFNPPVLNSYRKWNTDSCSQDKGCIAEGKGNRVLGEHGGKCKIERATAGFDTSNIRLYGKDEDRNPEQGEKAL